MHKILVSAGVLVVAGLIGYTTTNTVLNNNTQIATPSGAWGITPAVGYDPKTGEKYVGVEGSIDLEKLKKDPCWSENQTIQGLFAQINQTNDKIVRRSLETSLRKAQNNYWNCLVRNKKNTPMPPIKQPPVGIPGVKITPADQTSSIMPINSGAKPLPSSNYKLIKPGIQSR